MQRRHDTLNIPIELLRSFVAIQESGSFTKAADLLNLTQPAISAQVKRLQQLVGGEVFTRTGFGVSLTEKGEVVSRYARRILAMNDQILYLAGTNSSVPTFRVGIPSVFAASMLSRVDRGMPGHRRMRAASSLRATSPSNSSEVWWAVIWTSFLSAFLRRCRTG